MNFKPVCIRNSTFTVFAGYLSFIFSSALSFIGDDFRICNYCFYRCCGNLNDTSSFNFRFLNSVANVPTESILNPSRICSYVHNFRYNVV
jgi:hypothetical protein